MRKSNIIIALCSLLAFTTAPGFATTFGPVENFDVVNDTGKTAHGFEIELHDQQKSEITSIFGDASRWPNMERYGAPTVTEYPDSSAARSGKSVKITYHANYNGAWDVGTPSGTLPVNPSDSCWPYGAPTYGPSYPCDHFGVSSSIPAASVKYSWLLEAAPGSANLVYQDSGVPAPQWTIVPQPPINNQPQPPKVNVVIAAPKPQNYEFGEARWVKVTATGTLNNVAVEDLMAENAIIKKAKTQTQVEWQLLQVDAGRLGSGQIDLTGVALDPGASGVVYRFEFYKYTGYHDPETYEAISKNGDTATPAASDLGQFIVAQMAGVNFDGKIPPLPAPPAAPVINANISDVVINTGYSATIDATPSDPADILSYSADGLPAGLTVDATTGVISGQVDSSLVGQSFNININVVDVTNGTNTSVATTIKVVDAQITFAPVDQTGSVGVPFAYNLIASGGTGVFTFDFFGLLPDGLMFDPNSGIISGTPSIAGSSALTVNAIDSAGFNTPAPLNIVINDTPAVPANTACSGSNEIITNAANIRAAIVETGGGPNNGGKAIQLFQAKTTIVPPLSAATFFSGGNIITYSGVVSQGVCVTDVATVAQGLTMGLLANQTVDYNAPITPVPVIVSGGIAPYTVVVGNLPVGFTFDGQHIVGSSAKAGSNSVTISVNDANGQTSYQSFSITVNPPPAIVLGVNNIPASGVYGAAYTGSVSATGGVGSLNWSAAGLPAGIAMTSAGAISGTPMALGAFPVTLTVQDAAGQAKSITTNLTIAAPQVIISSSNIPATGQVGVNYSATEIATGGYGALTWTATGLPAGVKLSTAGAISGSPTTAGSYNVVLTVKDTLGATVSVSGSVTISTAPVGGGLSCTKPSGATGGLNSKGAITAINGNVISFKTGKGVAVTVTVPACAAIEWNGGAKAFAVGQVFEWNGYRSPATGNVAQSVTIN